MSEDQRRPPVEPLAADQLYAELVAAQAGLDEAATLRFQARLILLLVDRLADPAIVREALRAARDPRPG